jgi:hypothetical protein
LLTLMVVAVVIVRVARGQEVETLWAETLMIALANYFTTRRLLTLPPAVARRLEAEGLLRDEAHPLYLPRHSIRILLIVAFGGLAVYLYREGRLFSPEALSVLGVVFAYVLGMVARGLVTWWTGGRQTRIVRGWEDLKAATVLLVLFYTAGAYLLGHADLVPRQLQNITLGLVLFYFGSR